MRQGGGFLFRFHLFLTGECDKGVLEMAKGVGWEQELDDLVKGGKVEEGKDKGVVELVKGGKEKEG